jgi:hypothetical protein
VAVIVKPGHLTIAGQPPLRRFEHATAAPKFLQPVPQKRIQSALVAEQIRASSCVQTLSDVTVVLCYRCLERFSKSAFFHHAKPAHQGLLVFPACGDQRLPDARQLTGDLRAEQ